MTTSEQPQFLGSKDLRPIPDPTELTTAAVDRSEKTMKEWITSQLAIRDERLSAIDSATNLRLDALHAVPMRIAEELAHEREISDEKFKSVAQQFTERDTRIAETSNLNKIALDAAFAAQKEAAAKEGDANQKAIDKSERAVSERIEKDAALSAANNSALSDKLDDQKDRITALDLRVQRTEAAALGGHSAYGYVWVALGAMIGVGGLILGVVTAIIR